MSLESLKQRLFTQKEVKKEYDKIKPEFDKFVKKCKQKHNL